MFCTNSNANFANFWIFLTDCADFYTILQWLCRFWCCETWWRHQLIGDSILNDVIELTGFKTDTHKVKNSTKKEMANLWVLLYLVYFLKSSYNIGRSAITRQQQKCRKNHLFWETTKIYSFTIKNKEWCLLSRSIFFLNGSYRHHSWAQALELIRSFDRRAHLVRLPIDRLLVWFASYGCLLSYFHLKPHILECY